MVSSAVLKCSGFQAGVSLNNNNSKLQINCGLNDLTSSCIITHDERPSSL